MPRAPSSISATESTASCEPLSYQGIAWKMRACCSRLATRSKPNSPAWIARAAASRCARALKSMSSDAHGSIMTKSELIEIISAKQKHLPAKDVELAVKQLLEIMSDALATGERIEIRGFGSFSLHFRPPRQG